MIDETFTPDDLWALVDLQIGIEFVIKDNVIVDGIDTYLNGFIGKQRVMHDYLGKKGLRT